MFTGLITDIGTLTSAATGASGGRTFSIETSYDLADVELGESIAVDGACLTVTKTTARTFDIDASRETLDRTTLGDRKPGDHVHLERALRVGDRMGGHFVLGHVDGVGRITKKTRVENAWLLEIEAPATVTPYLIEKGSVTVDGVSLTVNAVTSKGFGIAVIPFTVEKTNLGDYTVGRRVNLEADVIGKYVHRLVAPHAVIDAEFLAKHGFGSAGK